MRPGSTPERWTACSMACAPSLTADRSLNPPANLPMGVRAPETMTDVVMANSSRVLERDPISILRAGRAATFRLQDDRRVAVAAWAPLPVARRRLPYSGGD